MSYLHIILIALIQGITEFLPISSSAHLILLPSLSGLTDQGNTIDVAAHVGTLAAVVIYFRRDVGFALLGLPQLIRGRMDTKNAVLAGALGIATIPVVILGLLLSITGLVDLLRSTIVIGWAMLLFGLLLYWADQRAVQSKTIDDLTWKAAFQLGLWQALALIPGTSRSGITITGALKMGFTRREAVRISMLMSIPTILASGTLASLDLVGGQINWRDAGLVALLSGIAAFAALTLMMRLLQSLNFTPYVIYRVIFGAILLILGYSGII